MGKAFCKRTKEIIVDGFQFHCVINEIPSKKFVNFKVYSSKTSYFEVLFTWEGSWNFIPHKPSNCERLIRYAIENGWEFSVEKKTFKIEQGDFLIDKLGLTSHISH
ncbi:hypothetical protein C7Y47_18790 [Lysinibacillus sphaericus]|uniref:Uncharacterized protein n=1 Tax=Lysinibacillus sphaericus TaxID=1421 RepID=A0A544UAD6_LYSSH|nr:hypothetical protein [Lysinibacillus sp. SDF0037]TQR29128.1 hypothetical protein C7Y47_18790 [Lysinibacillus sp. SDF0037]